MVSRPRIPVAVLRELRNEVGFRCPVAGCGSPYLTWHHFDPPWRVEQHNRPRGMVALCRVHADLADGGAYTDDQLRDFKLTGSARAEAIRGQFNWMRQSLIAVVGSNFYINTDIVLAAGAEPIVWFNRNESNEMLLNFWMPSRSGEPRARIEDNVWVVPPDVADLESPPLGGRILGVTYGNGDRFRVEFRSFDDLESLRKRYPTFRPEWYDEAWLGRPPNFAFPVTVVEVWLRTGEGDDFLEIGPKATTILGSTFSDSVFDSTGPRLPPLPFGFFREARVNEAMQIWDLIDTDRPPWIDRLRLTRCRINGPGIFSMEDSHLERPVLTSPDVASSFWKRPTSTYLVGAIKATNCLFEDCTFNGVAFAVPEIDYDPIIQSLAVPGGTYGNDPRKDDTDRPRKWVIP